MQGSLFDETDKKGDLYKAIDAVKNKFGKGSLQKARTVKSPEKDNPAKG
jgi:DNA polymerase-4